MLRRWSGGTLPGAADDAALLGGDHETRPPREMPCQALAGRVGDTEYVRPHPSAWQRHAQAGYGEALLWLLERLGGRA